MCARKVCSNIIEHRSCLNSKSARNRVIEPLTMTSCRVVSYIQCTLHTYTCCALVHRSTTDGYGQLCSNQSRASVCVCACIGSPIQRYRNALESKPSILHIVYLCMRIHFNGWHEKNMQPQQQHNHVCTWNFIM